MPHTIDEKGLRTLDLEWAEAVRRFSGQPAYTSFGKSLGFADIDTLANQLAAALQARGLRKGDRIALMMPNVMSYPVAMFACLKAGFIVVNVNPLYTRAN